jgi:hypothetical protein
MAKTITPQSTLRCPACAGVTEAQMPDDACVFFFECPHCGTMLRPRAGDCCVFCSYGDVPCPPKQRGDCCPPS